MTLGIAGLILGLVLIYSAINNVSVADALTGKAPPHIPSGSFLPGLDQPSGPGGSDAGPSGPMPRGMVKFDGHTMCAWIAQELQYARAHGWRGSVNNGYRSVAEQAQTCAHASGPCAPPGQSMHQGTAFPKCAVDINNDSGTDSPGNLQHYLRPGSPLVGAGSKDPGHYSHPHGGRY